MRLMATCRRALPLIMAATTLSPVLRADDARFVTGDVVVAVGTPMVRWYDSEGTPVRLLDTASTGGWQGGMCFDPSGNLYVPSFSAYTITKFNHDGDLITYPWGGVLDSQPASCVADSTGNIYVGEAYGSNRIRKCDSQGNVLEFFYPATGTAGVVWMDLRGGCDDCTLFYTTGDPVIRRFDVCRNQQLPDFATVPAPEAHGVRARLNGEVLAATDDAVYRYDPQGNLIMTYRRQHYTGATGRFVPIALAPDGESFWGYDHESAFVYQIHIPSGDLTTVFYAAPYG